MPTASRQTTWSSGQTLTAAALNGEFNHVITVLNDIDENNIDQTANYTWSGTNSWSGASTYTNTLTVGQNDAGHDVKFFGATDGAYMLWDEDVDDLKLVGAAGLIVPDGQFTLGSTAVTATGAEINLIDGGTARGTTAVASGDGILINDAGTMRMTNVDTVSTYFASHSVGGSNIATVGTITSGAWQSSTKIASAYLDDDTAHLSTTQTFSGAKTFSAAAQFSNNVTVTGVTTHGGNVVSDTDSTDSLGTTSVRWANLYVDSIGDTGQTLAVAGSVNFDSNTLFVDHTNNRIGIGTGSPSGRLDIESAASTTDIIINNTATNGDPTLQWQLSGTTKYMLAVDDDDEDRLVMIAGTSIPGNQMFAWDGNKNVGIGGHGDWGTNAVGVLSIKNGTPPASSPANVVQLYAEDVSSSSELKVRDEAGNITTLSPHNFEGVPGGPSEDLAWAYCSERSGRRISVDMLKLARTIERLSGETLVHITEGN